MSTIQIKAIVNAILELREKDNRMQEASDAFHEELYPDCNNPFLVGVTDGALKILDLVHPEISDWISYFIYEVPGLKRNNPDYDVIVKQNHNEYHLNTKEELITMLANEYPE